MLSDGTWTYAWEHGRELASMSRSAELEDTTITFRYDANGMRTTKTVTTNTYHTHSYTTTVTAPTCTDAGYTTYTCACGDSYQGNETAALGHQFDDATDTTCNRCDYNRYIGPEETIPVPTVPSPTIPVTPADFSVNSLSTTEEDRVPESTVVENHSYVYNGGLLMQEVIVTTVTTDEGTTTTTRTLSFAYDTAGTPMSVTYNDVTYYYVTNIQGDILAILNTSGTTVVQYVYDAWGNAIATYGSLASTIGKSNPLRYRGYVYDQETELYYLQSRYYDPKIGRFINADNYPATGQGLLGNNMFAYCNNNPILFADYTGKRRQPMPIYGLDETEVSIRDVTNEVGTALLEAANHGRRTANFAHLLFGDSILATGWIYMRFYAEVDHKAPWDIKRQKPWELTIGTPYPGFDRVICFGGIQITPEYLGNFTYGFLGYAYQIPLDHLIGGSFYAANFPTDRSGLSNEMMDWIYIAMGYECAKEAYGGK